jgi:hypothetical protein
LDGFVVAFAVVAFAVVALVAAFVVAEVEATVVVAVEAAVVDVETPLLLDAVEADAAVVVMISTSIPVGVAQ